MNWLRLFTPKPHLATSILHDERTFYQAFIRDLEKCKKEVIIECPFITSARMEKLLPIFKELLHRKVKVHIITRDPAEHDESNRHYATNEILNCKQMGVNIILLSGHHHRKLAIVDESILWEGSLNILSHCRSKEIMRRIEGRHVVKEMIVFLNLRKVL